MYRTTVSILLVFSAKPLPGLKVFQKSNHVQSIQHNFIFTATWCIAVSIGTQVTQSINAKLKCIRYSFLIHFLLPFKKP